MSSSTLHFLAFLTREKELSRHIMNKALRGREGWPGRHMGSGRQVALVGEAWVREA